MMCIEWFGLPSLLCSVAIDALKNFLIHTNSSAMVDFLEQQNAWTLMEKEDTCPHGCLHVARWGRKESDDL